MWSWIKLRGLPPPSEHKVSFSLSPPFFPRENWLMAPFSYRNTSLLLFWDACLAHGTISTQPNMALDMWAAATSPKWRQRSCFRCRTDVNRYMEWEAGLRSRIFGVGRVGRTLEQALNFNPWNLPMDDIFCWQDSHVNIFSERKFKDFRGNPVTRSGSFSHC